MIMYIYIYITTYVEEEEEKEYTYIMDSFVIYTFFIIKVKKCNPFFYRWIYSTLGDLKIDWQF